MSIVLPKSCIPPARISIPIHRVHAVPRECHASFVWLMEACDCMELEVDNVVFTSTDTGEFISAEGTVRVADCTANFLISEYWTPGHMSIYLIAGSKRYRLHRHRSDDALGGGGVAAADEDGIGAVVRALGGLRVE